MPLHGRDCVQAAAGGGHWFKGLCIMLMPSCLARQTLGCRWTGVTVSKQQLEEAAARVQRAGLAGRITLLFCDYRELPGTYDKVPPLRDTFCRHAPLLGLLVSCHGPADFTAACMRLSDLSTI